MTDTQNTSFKNKPRHFRAKRDFGKGIDEAKNTFKAIYGSNFISIQDRIRESLKECLKKI